MRNELGHFPEFCKKSVQAMASDMQGPIAHDFFQRRSVDDLASLSPRELESLGRLAYPVRLAHGASHFQRVSWEDALDRISTVLRATDPRRAFLYSSGRSSNEAAFLLQWLGRVYGTNNIHNCSFYCHQASSVGLGGSIGSGTATVTLQDVEHADFVMLIGANPASNHPRLITTLARIRSRGGVVVVVNPLREPGLDRFNIPSRPVSLLFGSRINDLYVQPRIGGDIALLKGVLKRVVQSHSFDADYIDRHTEGWDALVDSLREEAIETLAENAGVSVQVIDSVAEIYTKSRNAVFMWAMGVTHHDHGVDNVHAIANLALARGMVGRPHAGLMPIRGHSNVQGIGSVGFAPDLNIEFLKALESAIPVPTPSWRGLNSMESIEAAGRGEIDAALYLGGNFYASNPDLGFAASALGRIGCSIHISTKLNQGHVVPRPASPEGEVYILPTVARDEEAQSTTQESMFSFVRLSEGGRAGSAGEMRTEVDIIASIGCRLLSSTPIDFNALRSHDEIRRVIARVVPGYAEIAEIGSTGREFHVAGRVRHEPHFGHPNGRARFVPVSTPNDMLAPNELRLMTIRSEGQFNTVVYEEHDRYRNQQTRDVILMNSVDMKRNGLNDGDRVTVGSLVGIARDIRVSAYDIAEGCAAMYYPEANVLVPRTVDPKSGTPSFKNVRVTVTRQPATNPITSRRIQ